MPLEGDRKPFQAVLPTPNTFRTAGALSPDGRWLAYLSNESGAVQAYVTGFNQGHGKWQISTNGGFLPLWSRDGKELYYVEQGNTLYAVSVKEESGTLHFGPPQILASNWTMPAPFYQLSADGKRILLYRVSQQVSDSITVVTNFPESLKK